VILRVARGGERGAREKVEMKKPSVKVPARACGAVERRRKRHV
jgi:hypothetical protein